MWRDSGMNVSFLLVRIFRSSKCVGIIGTLKRHWNADHYYSSLCRAMCAAQRASVLAHVTLVTQVHDHCRCSRLEILGARLRDDCAQKRTLVSFTFIIYLLFCSLY